MIVNRDAMIDVAKRAMQYQDVGNVEAQLALYAQDCSFKMPTTPVPMQGLGELRKSIEQWPKAVTQPEWFAIDGNRLVTAWNWRGEGWPEDLPLLRGVSIFVFNDEGLIQHYEDFFDPDWRTRHASQ